MKKKVVLLVVMISMFSFSVVFAADKGITETSGKLMNGVTYSDLGPASPCWDADAALASESTARPFNGITAFDLGQPGSGAKGSCAGQRTKESMMKGYNGITVF